jgi:hypothetical protein
MVAVKKGPVTLGGMVSNTVTPMKTFAAKASSRSDTPQETPDDAQIVERVTALLDARSADKSICPSDVARSFSDDEATWRAMMPAIRDVAARMADDRLIRVTQGSTMVDLNEPVRGPIRLRRGDRFPSTS